MPFEVYAPDPDTTWKLLCDQCREDFLPEKVTSFRVVNTDFRLCSGCFAKFRQEVSRDDDPPE